MAAWYRQGTIALTNGNAAVTGALTGWTNQVKAGDALLAPDGKWYEVAADAASNTALTLATVYTGTTASGQSYAINRCSSAWGQASSISSALAALLALLPVPGGASEALKELRTNAAGTAYALGGGRIATSVRNRIAKFSGTGGDTGQTLQINEDDAGNVGIGTAAPTTRLHVAGPDRFSTPHQVYLMGDSLTNVSTHYGTQLAANLGASWGVVWKGIAGNTTTQMLARFTTDVITPGNAEYVIVWGGVNDIAAGATATTIKANLQAMYDAAHAAGIKVVAVNITPFSGDAGWASSGAPARAVQDSVNAWIATGARNVDYRINMYSVLVDPSVPYTLLPAYDDGGHLHLTTAGYTAAGNAIFAGTTWSPVKNAAATIDGPATVTSPVTLGSDLTVVGDVTLKSKLTFSSADPTFYLKTLDPTISFGLRYGTNDAALVANTNTGSFDISVGRSVGWGGVMTFTVDTAEVARLTNAGRLGLGTAAPASRLHVEDATPIAILRATNNAVAFGHEFQSAGGQFEASIKHASSTGELQINAGRAVGWGGSLSLVTDTVERLRISAAGGIAAAAIIKPQTDNAYTLGASGARFTTVYATTGTINTSDENEKEDVAPSDLGLSFVQALAPVSYRWINGGVDVTYDDEGAKTETVRPGRRRHYGLIAQQVKAALDAAGCTDFAGWVLADKDDPQSLQSLRYDQFIAPLIRAVQELAATSTALRSEFDAYRDSHP